MADLIIKPATGAGNKLILQDKAGGAVLTTADSGATVANVTLDNSTQDSITRLGTVTTGTIKNTIHTDATFPSQYNFYVKMSQNISGSNGTWTVAQLNTAVWGTFDTSNYKFVVPKAGKWMFFYSVRFQDGVWGRFLALSINGTVLTGGASSTIARPGGHVSYGFSSYNPNYFNHACLNLAANDEIKLHFRQHSGGTASIQFNDDGFDTTFLTGYRLLGG